MSSTVRNLASRRSRMAFVVAAAMTLASCDQIEDFFGINQSSDDEASFLAHAAPFGSQPFTPILVRGKHCLFFADEASSGTFGTNLNSANGDLGLDDQIPVFVDMTSNNYAVIRVSTESAQLLDSDVYMAVNERSDSWDWNGDGQLTSRVLLHYPGTGGSPAAPNVEYVDDLDAGAPVPMLAVGPRLYYSASLFQSVAGGQSNLKWVDAAQPATPVVVPHNIALLAGQPARPRIARADEKLLFLTMSEQLGFELNGDGDNGDFAVLLLLDTTDPAAPLLNTELALDNNNPSPALRARSTASHDWLVAFLVSEAQQNNFATGLNDPAGLGFPAQWRPSNCPAYSDTDTTDDVLHFIRFAAWSAAPLANPPVNTGLVGANRVLATTNGFVATLAPEADDGLCSTNGDPDIADVVLRWTSTANPLMPFTNENDLVASIASPGGSFGVAELGNRFVCVVDEAADNRNHDADSNVNATLVAWLDPADGATAKWTYDHDPTKIGIQAAGASWLGEVEGRARVAVGYQEIVVGTSLNHNDTDRADSVPAFAYFDSATPPRLRFPYSGTAVDGSNAGIVVAGGWAFTRVSEAADNRDWTGANLLSEDVLMFSSVASPTIGFIGALNFINGASVVSDGQVGAAFMTQEPMAQADFNGDGDFSDFVVRWVTF